MFSIKNVENEDDFSRKICEIQKTLQGGDPDSLSRRDGPDPDSDLRQDEDGDLVFVDSADKDWTFVEKQDAVGKNLDF